MKRAESYIYRVYKENSFSSAAKKLYISQPSLSATVKKQEEELGFAVFDRSKTPMSLTPKGKIYIEYLEEVYLLEKQMIKQLKSLEPHKSGPQRLTVGGTNFSAHYLMPKLCGEFHRRYPEVEIRIDACNKGDNSVLSDGIMNNIFELAISHNCSDSRFEAIPIMKDRLIVAMRKDTEGAERLIPWAMTAKEVLSDEITGKEFTDISIFSGIDFIHIGKMTSIYKYMGKLMDLYSVSNCLVNNSRRFDMHFNMMAEGMGAVITSESVIYAKRNLDNIIYFKPKDNPERSLYILHRKNQPISSAAREFIDLTVEMCKDKNKLFS